MMSKAKLEIGAVVKFQGKETVVISFIPNWNKYLLAGFGNPVKLEDIEVQKSKSSIRSKEKKLGN
jgi:superfamily I DNA and/or RNA helicase